MMYLLVSAKSESKDKGKGKLPEYRNAGLLSESLEVKEDEGTYYSENNYLAQRIEDHKKYVNHNTRVFSN